eukprot:jgi/Botrbrau1/6240/Bobra.0109s0034.1
MHNSKGECSVEYVSRNAVLDHTDQACREGSTTDSVKVDICSNGTVVVTLSEHCPVKLVAPVGDTVAPPSACGTTVHPNSNGKDTSTDTKKDGAHDYTKSPLPHVKIMDIEVSCDREQTFQPKPIPGDVDYIPSAFDDWWPGSPPCTCDIPEDSCIVHPKGRSVSIVTCKVTKRIRIRCSP